MPNHISDSDFHAVLDGEDELGSVIRVHLHIEHYVEQLIGLLAVEPARALSMKLDYSQKLDLLVLLGVNHQVKPMLLQLGVIRNKFAHNLGYKLSHDIVDALYNKLPPPQKQLIHSCYKKAAAKIESTTDSCYKTLSPKAKFTLIAIVIRRHLITLLEKLDGQFVVEPIV
ncbi:hypothetical protein [Vibrio cholerae]|uniref:hypothetical protein n=1 Tax=Vibrio cholerae TaxID=666 RepID=UPI002DB67FEC|nr:hypothetical protein [Vibrio cholerae]MEB5541996.1 hypothetical protein [Vibrio cholerae]MEB5550620.1 hypothetical protein [Vibrio cholerae]